MRELQSCSDWYPRTTPVASQSSSQSAIPAVTVKQAVLARFDLSARQARVMLRVVPPFRSVLAFPDRPASIGKTALPDRH